MPDVRYMAFYEPGEFWDTVVQWRDWLTRVAGGLQGGPGRSVTGIAAVQAMPCGRWLELRLGGDPILRWLVSDLAGLAGWFPLRIRVGRGQELTLHSNRDEFDVGAWATVQYIEGE